jgi:hypothetical protein
VPAAEAQGPSHLTRPPSRALCVVAPAGRRMPQLQQRLAVQALAAASASPAGPWSSPGTWWSRSRLRLGSPCRPDRKTDQ